MIVHRLTEAKYKIDLAAEPFPYRYTLWKLINSKWVPLQNNDSIAVLEEVMREDQRFPIYYDKHGELIR